MNDDLPFLSGSALGSPSKTIKLINPYAHTKMDIPNPSAKSRMSINQLLEQDDRMPQKRRGPDYYHSHYYTDRAKVTRIEPTYYTTTVNNSNNNNNGMAKPRITCLYPSVAQKSYGSEKRFLCPPPKVLVSSTTQANSRSVTMSIMGTDPKPAEQQTTLDDHGSASFKYLHVSGDGKAKNFKLRIRMGDTRSFDTSPITIISKPSKKTSRARNVSTCISHNHQVSLFNRINSQTVRTKYMTFVDGQLCANNASWSPFTMEVTSASPGDARDPSHLTYGSTLVLRDPITRQATKEMIIRKVEQNHIQLKANGPVSQMQKVALELADTPHKFLSAAGSQPTETSDDSASSSPASPTTPSGRLDFVTLSPSGDDPDLVVDDYVCWTIVGIDEFTV